MAKARVRGRHRRDDFPELCLLKGHDWKKNAWTGKSLSWEEREALLRNTNTYQSHKEEVQHYNCSRSCGSHKYEMLNWGRELTREERAIERIRFRDGISATMWILDNVQPAYSSDGTGYEQEGSDE